jgi:hypothetical protein
MTNGKVEATIVDEDLDLISSFRSRRHGDINRLEDTLSNTNRE